MSDQIEEGERNDVGRNGKHEHLGVGLRIGFRVKVQREARSLSLTSTQKVPCNNCYLAPSSIGLDKERCEDYCQGYTHREYNLVDRTTNRRSMQNVWLSSII